MTLHFPRALGKSKRSENERTWSQLRCRPDVKGPIDRGGIDRVFAKPFLKAYWVLSRAAVSHVKPPEHAESRRRPARHAGWEPTNRRGSLFALRFLES